MALPSVLCDKMQESEEDAKRVALHILANVYVQALQNAVIEAAGKAGKEAPAEEGADSFGKLAMTAGQQQTSETDVPPIPIAV